MTIWWQVIVSAYIYILKGPQFFPQCILVWLIVYITFFYFIPMFSKISRNIWSVQFTEVPSQILKSLIQNYGKRDSVPYRSLLSNEKNVVSQKCKWVTVTGKKNIPTGNIQHIPEPKTSDLPSLKIFCINMLDAIKDGKLNPKYPAFTSI